MNLDITHTSPLIKQAMTDLIGQYAESVDLSHSPINNSTALLSAILGSTFIKVNTSFEIDITQLSKIKSLQIYGTHIYRIRDLLTVNLTTVEFMDYDSGILSYLLFWLPDSNVQILTLSIDNPDLDDFSQLLKIVINKNICFKTTGQIQLLYDNGLLKVSKINKYLIKYICLQQVKLQVVSDQHISTWLKYRSDITFI